MEDIKKKRSISEKKKLEKKKEIVDSDSEHDFEYDSELEDIKKKRSIFEKKELEKKEEIIDPNLSSQQIFDIEYRIQSYMKVISELKVIKYFNSQFSSDLKMYLFGGAVRNIIQNVIPTDYDIIITSNSSTRGKMFQYLNRAYNGDLDVYRGYGGTLNAVDHVLVKLPGIDLVFVEHMETMKFDFDVNTLCIKLGEPNYNWHHVIECSSRTKHSIVKNIMHGNMIPMNNIDVIMKTKDKYLNLEHQLYRICKMYAKGYINIDQDGFINFFKIYEAYKKQSKDSIISEDLIYKRKYIDDMSISVFDRLRKSLD